MKQNEFYVGYHDKMPFGIKSFIKLKISMVAILTVFISMILVLTQKAFYPSQFEYLNYQSFTGIILEKPYPMLLVNQPVKGKSAYYLVDFGKFGASQSVKSLNGRSVKLSGSLIYRDNQTMLEIESGKIEIIENTDSVFTNESEISSNVTLVGEIVDSKCFFGVMKPGNLKAHKSCAIRCISGGIPPVLVVKNKITVDYYLLVSSTGEAVNQAVLDKVAVPVQIVGELVKSGQINILKADPNNYIRL